MTESSCLNLCEVADNLYEAYESIDNIVTSAEKRQGVKHYARIYIGSNFCSQYFLNLSQILLEKISEYASKENIKVTLVLPVFTEKNLERAKSSIDKYMAILGKVLDEITVNDYGMLEHIASTYKEIGINMGRLFMKDYRDPRYPKYFEVALKPRIFTKYLDELIKTYGITGMEFDPTHMEIDFEGKPQHIEIGLHEPYCYMTVGQICEFASIHKDISQKFRPNSLCERECMTNRIKYFNEDDREWLRIGKTIYFKNEPQISGIEKIRKIYFPIDMEEK